MKKNVFAIIEVGSNNTKTHIYKKGKLIADYLTTIKFKANYAINNCITQEDLNKLCEVVKQAQKTTNNVNLYGCSIFRTITSDELNRVNTFLKENANVCLKVVSAEEETEYTAYGCYKNVNLNKNICIFIGGGGSVELALVNNKKIIDKKCLPFGVIDITKKFPSLNNDIPSCSFADVESYVKSLITNLNWQADIMIMAGGNHPYWYNSANYKMLKNTVYKAENQKYMLTAELNNTYDHDCLTTSLNAIKERSDNPAWFDGGRAMKVISNVVANKVGAKYIIPTKIGMEDGIKETLL